jgi:hypothetical protein
MSGSVVVMLAVQGCIGIYLQQCCHYFYLFFHLLHQRKGYFHREEGPQELGTRSQRLSGMGHGVGNVSAVFHMVG